MGPRENRGGNEIIGVINNLHSGFGEDHTKCQTQCQANNISL